MLETRPNRRSQNRTRGQPRVLVPSAQGQHTAPHQTDRQAQLRMFLKIVLVCVRLGRVSQRVEEGSTSWQAGLEEEGVATLSAQQLAAPAPKLVDAVVLCASHSRYPELQSDQSCRMLKNQILQQALRAWSSSFRHLATVQAADHARLDTWEQVLQALALSQERKTKDMVPRFGFEEDHLWTNIRINLGIFWCSSDMYAQLSPV